MIRLLDCEVYAVEIAEVSRSMLFSHFCAKGHQDDLIVVYDNNTYYGNINYQTLLKTASEKKEDFIDREQYIHKINNGDMWKELKRIFEMTNIAYCPIFNETGELLYFAYNDIPPSECDYEGCFDAIEKECPEVFFDDVFPEVKMMRIYNLNEWAWRLYNILKKYHFPVEVVGEKWEALFPDYINSDILVAETAVMNIWADGKIEIFKREAYIWGTWHFLYVLCCKNLLYRIERRKKQALACGVQFMTMYFPMTIEARNVDEAYRSECRTSPNLRRSWLSKIEKKQIEKVMGYTVECEEFLKSISNRYKNRPTINVHDRKVYINRFGETENCIYLIGPCLIEGVLQLKEEEIFGYCLYQELQQVGLNYSIVCVTISEYDYWIFDEVYERLHIKSDDIVIVAEQVDFNKNQSIISDIQVKEILERREDDWFFDIPLHTSYRGNLELSKAIVEEYLVPILKKIFNQPNICTYLQIGKRELSEKESGLIETYLQKVKAEKEIPKNSKVGAIVMNCNPMTKGHKYLIDTARKQVDYLYVFIVEENKSEYTFEERFALVKEEVKGVENVIVVPSGEFVLSYKTMPLYFEKAQKQDATLDATGDLQIFGQYIAPALGITERFVGEEPTDKVTKQYNESMKNILPHFGVHITEIPRIANKAGVISASKVREYVKEKEWDKVKLFVTNGVYEYLYTREN